MSLRPTVMINSIDDVALRKAHKEALSDRVEELGVGSFLVGVVKKVAKKALGIDDPDYDFDDSKHPRGPDGRFVEAPKGVLSRDRKGFVEEESARAAREIKAKKEALYKVELKKWERDKAKWDADELAKGNKKIQIIHDEEMKSARTQLKQALRYLKGNLSDKDFERGTKDFQKAHQRVKDIKAKINRIQPEPYKVAKPKKP